MFSKTEYIILAVIGLLWVLQMLYLLFFYNSINRAQRHFTPKQKKRTSPQKSSNDEGTYGTTCEAEAPEEESITIDMTDETDFADDKTSSNQNTKVMLEATPRDYDETVRPQSARQLSFFDMDDTEDEEEPSPVQASLLKANETSEPISDVAISEDFNQSSEPDKEEETTLFSTSQPTSEQTKEIDTPIQQIDYSSETIIFQAKGISRQEDASKEASPKETPNKELMSKETTTAKGSMQDTSLESALHPFVPKSASTSDALFPSLSVIIVTSNQDSLLRKNLPYVLEQDYPNFEVIVVNDNSSDDTSDVLEFFKKRYPHLRTTFTSDSARRISHKKLALTLGIKAATSEWVVFTEPHCRPATNQWLRALAQSLKKDSTSVDAVVGYTAMEKSNGFISLVRCADNMLRGVRLLCSALCRKAYMAYGTNLLYHRSLFFEHKGYSSHLNLERGDDDIFVNENIAPSRIHAAIGYDASVILDTPDSHSWMLEKTGRIATRRYLRGIMPLLLSFETITRALYVVGTLVFLLVALLSSWWVTAGIILLLWIIRLVCQLLILLRTRQVLGEQNFIPFLPLLDMLLPFIELRYRIRYAFSSKTAYQRKQL